MKRLFFKPATTYSQQIALLQQRGMIIEILAEVEFYLQHLNYYRLSAYRLPFESDHASPQFKSGTHFADVLNLYIFDRELRLLVLDAIERVEVSLCSHQFIQGSRKLYNTLVMLLHCRNVVAPKHQWCTRLKNLLGLHTIETTAMGFPKNWEQLPLWQEATK
jgi:abortive infection bacteriophage resistance protein